MIVGVVGVGIPAFAGAAEEAGTGAGRGGGALSAAPWVYLISGVVAAVVLAVLWRRDVIRPGSFGKGRTRRAGELPWFVWLVAGLVVFMAQQVGAGLALAVMGPSGSGAAGVEGLRRAAVQHGASYAAALAAGVAMVRALRGAAEGLEFRALDAPRGAAAFVLAYPVIYAVTGAAVLVATLVRGAPLEPVAHEALKQIIDHRGSGWAWALAGGAVLGAPVVEELMYRVFLQTALLRLWGRAWPAILAASTLFAAVHYGVAELHALPVLLVLGLSMGIAYERTRSPVVPIVMHALFNLLNVVLALMLR